MPKSDDNNANSGFKCTHIEFPNHPMEKYHQQSLVEIRSFDRNTFRQTFSRFGHVIRSYFGYAYKIRHQIECRLLYCIKFYIISVSIPFGKLSANIQPFRSCESVKFQLGLKFGKKIKTN